ncbi:MAG: hypothetical protein R3B06_23120 [Kofleriaceae bacterium]
MTTLVTLAAGAALATAQPAPPPTPAPAPAPGDPKGPPKKVTDEDMATAHSGDERPWADGVSQAEQQTAVVLFGEGNKLLRDSLFPKAVAKYQEALGHWKHPAIYYNLALALVNLDQPLQILEALDHAMEYGAAPLDADKFDRAKGYKLLVEKQIGQVEYTLSVAGAKLVLDGKEVFTGPGTYSARVRAGEHTVVARAEGYTPVPLTVKILGGTTSAITIPMYTDAELTRESRKMPNWVPYSVLGAGVVVASVGGLLHNSAKGNFDSYDQAVSTCASTDPTGGCSTLPGGVAAMKASAESNQRLAFTAYAVGGAAVVAGVVLVILNRPHTYRIDPTRGAADLALTPVVGRDLSGLALSGSF